MRFLKSKGCARMGGSTHHLICPQQLVKAHNWPSIHPLSASSSRSAVVTCARLAASAGLHQGPTCHCHDTSVSLRGPAGLNCSIYTGKRSALKGLCVASLRIYITTQLSKIQASHLRHHHRALGPSSQCFLRGEPIPWL